MENKNNVKHPCQGCKYYITCGESNRTAPCEGRETKGRKKNGQRHI